MIMMFVLKELLISVMNIFKILHKQALIFIILNQIWLNIILMFIRMEKVVLVVRMILFILW